MSSSETMIMLTIGAENVTKRTDRAAAAARRTPVESLTATG
jgi:hypothetical protein